MRLSIQITNFPKPELLTIETDFKYYDKKEGWANPFTASDLSEITAEAKQHIVDKVPGSGVMQEAAQQGLDTLQMIEKLAETINWKLDYSAINVPDSNQKSLSEK